MGNRGNRVLASDNAVNPDGRSAQGHDEWVGNNTGLLFDDDPMIGADPSRNPGPEPATSTTGRSLLASPKRYLKRRPLLAQTLLMAFAAVVVFLWLGVFSGPADGPTQTSFTLAEEVMSSDPLRVETGTPTSLSSLSVDPPPPQLNPNALFVSPGLGDDGFNGTGFETPLQSLQTALNQVEPGQTIYLMDGSYTELVEPRNAHYVAKRGGTADAWVRIERMPDHQPLIIASNGNGLEIQADYVEVSGLTVRGEGYDTENNPWSNGILIRNSHHVRIVGNEISGLPLNGVSTVESSNLVIADNEIYENAFWNHSQGSGISLWHSVTNGEPPDGDGYHDRVIGNRLYRNENKVKSVWKDYQVITDGNGIIIDQGRETNYEGRVLVANNEIFDNGGRGIMVFETDRVDVMYNTVFHNGRTEDLDGGPAELTASRARDVRFYNNLVWPRDGSVAVRTANADGVVTGGNLIVNTGDPGQVTDADTVLSSGPALFNPSIDENVADFRPTAESMAIGAAVTVRPRLNWDRDGADRRLARPTAGAYALPAD